MKTYIKSFKTDLFLIAITLLLHACRMPAGEEDAQIKPLNDSQFADLSPLVDMNNQGQDHQVSDFAMPDQNLQDQSVVDLQVNPSDLMVDLAITDMMLPLCQPFPVGIETRFESPLAINQEQKIAQTFTSPQNTSLSALRLAIGCEEMATLSIEIRSVDASGLPDLTVDPMAEIPVPAGTFPTVLNTWTNLSIPAFPLSENQRFALVFKGTSIGQGCSMAQSLGLSHEYGNGYYAGSPNPADRWESLCPPLGGACDLPITLFFNSESASACLIETTPINNECTPTAFPYNLSGTSPTIAVGGQSEQSLAQVFTSPLAQTLRSVTIPVGCTQDTSLRIEVQDVTDGRPNGRILSTQVSRPDQVNVPVGLPIEYQIPPVALRENQSFAVVIYTDPILSHGDEISCGLKPLIERDVIASGNAYYKSYSNPIEQWNPLCQLETDVCDLPFHLGFAASGAVACADVQALEAERRLEIILDPSMDLSLDGSSSIPGENGIQRPLAGVRASNGLIGRFVADEILLLIHRQEDLDRLIAEYQVELISTFDPTTLDLTKVDPSFTENGTLAELQLAMAGVGRLVLVKVSDQMPMDVDALRHEIKQNLPLLFPLAHDTLTFSSEKALKTLAIATRINLQGDRSLLNWVSQLDDISHRHTTEAPSIVSGIANNAFDWNFMSLGGVFNTGVAETWRIMEIAGVLTTNRIGVGILDDGFRGVHQDYPSQMTFLSAIPFVGDIRDTTSVMSCAGNPCPWHGTGSALTAFGMVDNAYGAAGPAGPVARGIVTSVMGDMFTVMPGILMTIANGARVINMSFGMRVPAPLSFSVLPFEAMTRNLSRSVLFVASAGNQSLNVDEEDCILSWCWEETWVSPCENAGVYCIGAADTNLFEKASYSNWGTKLNADSVDFFAPGSILVGLRSDGSTLMPLSGTDNYADLFSGTSAASPFVAGSLALLWSIQPSLTPQALMNNLRFKEGEDLYINQFIQVYDTAVRLFGGIVPNARPEIFEVSPEDEAHVQLNVPTVIVAQVEDVEDGASCCQIEFRSNLEGLLGNGGRTITHAFQIQGRHEITAIARDSQNAISEPYVFHLTVDNQAPEILITRPTQGASVYQYIGFRASAIANDINEISPLDCSRFEWRIENQIMGESIEMIDGGCQVQIILQQLGDRQITIRVTDQQGLATAQILNVHVMSRPSNLPPNGRILVPAERQHFNYPTDPIQFTAEAIDPEGEPLSVVWFASWGAGLGIGGPAIAFDTLSFSWTAANDGLLCELGLINIPVRVDLVISDGNTVVEADQVSFFMDCPPP